MERTVGAHWLALHGAASHSDPAVSHGVLTGAGPLDAASAPAHHERVSGWARLRLYAAMAVGAAGLLVGVGYAWYAELGDLWGHFAWIGLVVLPLYAVAVWLVRLRPDHPQARRLLVIAAAMSAQVAIESIVRERFLHDGADPWLWVANTLHQLTSLVGVAAGGALLACYPGGTPDGPWLRRLVAAMWWMTALPFLLLLCREDMVLSIYLFDTARPDTIASPLAIGWLAPLGPVLAALLYGSPAAVAGAVVLVTRYVRADRELRHRMRPLVYAIYLIAPLAAATVVLEAMGVSPDSPTFILLNSLLALTLAMLPVSIAISVLRHRLLDIDVALRRSAVYGVLAAGIAVAYVAVAAAPGLALGDQVPVELAVATTVVAAVAFQPVRRRLEVVADRWVFGERANRYQLVTSFGATLEQTVDLDELLPRLATTLRDGLRASWVRVSLRGGDSGTWLSMPRGTAGTVSGEAVLVEQLRHGDEVVGRIECGAGDGGFDQADRELLSVLAGQAATAIANVRLTARLGEQVTELARSRARIVSAQDDERRRIERDIHDGVQQTAVALLTKLRLARNRAARGESPESLLAETQADAGDLLSDLRELAHGIHPPVLTDGGLVAAVEARAGRLPLGVTVRADLSTRTRRFGADVEAAAYFVACEALTNVVKHAGASQAVVSLTADDGLLRLQVRDDGAGLNGSGGKGHGLTNLRDRVEALGGQLLVEGGDGGGTSLSAALPIGAGRG